MDAAEDRLEVNVEVIDPQSLSPFDVDTIAASVRKTSRLVVNDESPHSYGLRAEVASRVTERKIYLLDVPIPRVCVSDTLIPFSPPLKDEVLSGAAEINSAIDRIV
ncbi:transketolase C-terminal domain-containing protein [Halegenticoccus soli]|uniref:transketolase C-terminal domain-containing protein n=1 Tax=Halegenticoccus soli TaxID=1985678 RepID=UPI0018ED4057|nr:transketolase C-terminal domain-containing protein [Halegenticoccus soli]